MRWTGEGTVNDRFSSQPGQYGTDDLFDKAGNDSHARN